MTKKMKSFVTLSLYVFLLTIGESNGLTRCYVCQTSGFGPDSDECGDDFRLTSNHASDCDGTCQKTRGYRSQGSRKVVEVTRGCISYTSSVGCREGTHLGIDATICTCNTYYCNTASALIPSPKFVFLLVCLLSLLVNKIL